jgi:cation transport regulator ChaC
MVWYFAYGSNMQDDTLCRRRGIAYRRALPARATGWRVVFDKPLLLPVPYAVANLVPDAEASALGVAFEISEDDLAHVELTEGVRIGHYHRVEVGLIALDPSAGASLAAYSLSSDRRDPALRPSTRYMALVIAGAEQHGLPAAYVEYLRNLPAHEETADVAGLRPFVDEVLRRNR